MSNLKKFLAMTLVVVMTASSIAATASARIFDDVNGTGNAALIKAIDLLSDLGIIKGYADGTFGVHDFVERQQMAMFIARIRTSVPEYFVEDTKNAAGEWLNPVHGFADVNDPMFHTAINYCIEENIINGYGDGTFLPNQRVTLQEAVKMICTALGYNELSYPVGYLSKGKEIGLFDNFGLSEIGAGDALTRGQVAALLYNYFFNSKYEFTVVSNSVGIKEAIPVYTPVSASFGIDRISGYITGVEDRAIDLRVPFEAPAISNVTQYGNLNGTAVSRKNAEYELNISYITDVYSYSSGGSILGAKISQKDYGTTKAALGLAEEYPGLQGSWELLGLKIIAYVNNTTNKNLDLILPSAELVGKKTDVSLNVTANYNYATERTTAFSIIGSVNRAFDMTNPSDVNAYNVYTYRSENAGDGSSGIKWRHGHSADQGISTLGKMVAAKAATDTKTPSYDLEYIDNGDGEFFFMFTPYQIKYYEKDTDDGSSYIFRNTKNDEYKKSKDLIVRDAGDVNKSVYLSAGNAYLYAVQGDYILIKAALSEEHATFDNTAVSVSGNSVTFNITNPSLPSNNYTSYSTLLLSYDDAMLGKADNFVNLDRNNPVSNTGNGLGFVAMNMYKLFSLDGIVLFAWTRGQSSGVVNVAEKFYGVVVSPSTSIYLNNVIHNAVTVYNANQSETETIVYPVSNVGAISKKGTLVVYTRTGVSTHFIQGIHIIESGAGTSLASAFISSDESGYALANNMGIWSSAALDQHISYSLPTSVMSIGTTFTPTVTGSTVIVAMGALGELAPGNNAGNIVNNSSGADTLYVNRLTLNQFQMLMSGGGQGDIAGVAAISNSATLATGSAKVIFLLLNGIDIGGESTQRTKMTPYLNPTVTMPKTFATILEHNTGATTGSGGVVYNHASAYDYVRGVALDIVYANTYAFNVGNVVEVTTDVLPDTNRRIAIFPTEVLYGGGSSVTNFATGLVTGSSTVVSHNQMFSLNGWNNTTDLKNDPSGESRNTVTTVCSITNRVTAYNPGGHITIDNNNNPVTYIISNTSDISTYSVLADSVLPTAVSKIRYEGRVSNGNNALLGNGMTTTSNTAYYAIIHADANNLIKAMTIFRVSDNAATLGMTDY